MTEFVRVPHDRLTADALRGLVEAIINREGTDYGEVERTLEEKVADVMAQLRSGRAAIVFDPESASCTVVPSDRLQG